MNVGGAPRGDRMSGNHDIAPRSASHILSLKCGL